MAGATNDLNLEDIKNYLKKHNLLETVLVFEKELGGNQSADFGSTCDNDAESSSELEGIDSFESEYSFLARAVGAALDSLKPELSTLLFPVFCHLYLDLISNGQPGDALKFFDRFEAMQSEYHKSELSHLRAVRSPEHLQNSDVARALKNEPYVVNLSRNSYEYLKKQLELNRRAFLMELLKNRLNVDLYDGPVRSRQKVEAAFGSILGENRKDENQTKILYGINRELDPILDEDDATPESSVSESIKGRPSKKRLRKDMSIVSRSSRTKSSPCAPPIDRIPLPEMTESDKMDKKNAVREAAKRQKLSRDHHPSVYCHTIHNSGDSLCAINVSDDSTRLVAGFETSIVKVWTLTDQPLKCLKPYSELSTFDLDDEVGEGSLTTDRLLDDRSASEWKCLTGHRGAVYGCGFSPDKQHVISCSADNTVRLWSLYTYTNLVVYKGHIGPVWDVDFGPQGYYFVSAGADRTVRLWATDQNQPLRIFPGHHSDVECVKFHPNSNYVFSGGADRILRLWDVTNGSCVRQLCGIKGQIASIAVNPMNGRFVAVGDTSGSTFLFDLAQGSHPITTLVDSSGKSPGAVYSTSFDRDGVILATGHANSCLKLWDVNKITEPLISSDSSESSADFQSEGLLMSTLFTKDTPVKLIHFTRLNLMLVGGNYQPSKTELSKP